MLPFPPRRGLLAAGGCAALALAAPPAHAQPAPSAPATADRWTVRADYLHLGAAPIHRRAEPSMGVALARTVAGDDASRALRVEAGWLRASRAETQAQGVTLGTSLALPFGRMAAWDGAAGPTLIVRPGVALLAGWAEAQGRETGYDWRGASGTALDGQAGAQPFLYPVRGRTTGGGLSLAADLRLTPSLALVGSVQRWAFTGAVIRPNRQATLAGVGLAVHPGSLARGLRRGPAPGAAAPARAAAALYLPTVVIPTVSVPVGDAVASLGGAR